MNGLEFTLSEKDLLAFFEYHAGNSPMFQRSRRAIVLFSSVIIGTLALTAASLLHEFLMALLGIILAIAVGLTLKSINWNKHYAMNAIKLYREGRNLPLGNHQIRAESEWLTLSCEQEETKRKWAAIEKVASTPDYTFIYVSPVSAIIIPKNSITKGNHEEFARTVREYCQTTAEQDVA